MTKDEYHKIEAHMLYAMKDSAHDRMHVKRVLYLALDIATHETGVNYDVLIASCLLHDIGRQYQAEDLELDHAEIGAELAYSFLTDLGWDDGKAGHVKACVQSHRYRKGNSPATLEAKILFDADKLDVTGAMGIARTLIYGGQIGEPLYFFDDTGRLITQGGGAEISSFLQEYNYKIVKLYDSFFTDYARALGQKRKRAMTSFYQNLVEEIESAHDSGTRMLDERLS